MPDDTQYDIILSLYRYWKVVQRWGATQASYRVCGRQCPRCCLFLFVRSPLLLPGNQCDKPRGLGQRPNTVDVFSGHTQEADRHRSADIDNIHRVRVSATPTGTDPCYNKNNISTTSPTELRRAEFNILAKEVYRRISSKRYGNYLPAYTILMGDYNLCLMGSPKVNKIVPIDKDRYLLTVQNEKTTVKQCVHRLINNGPGGRERLDSGLFTIYNFLINGYVMIFIGAVDFIQDWIKNST